MMRSRLTALLVSSLFLRLSFSPFFGHPWDMYIWLKSGELALANINIYLLENPVDYPWGFYAYPPTWLYWLIIPAIVNRLTENLYLAVFLIKLPIIISDVLGGLLIYRIASKLGCPEGKSLLVTSVWLFNPITFFISSIWGMFDSIAALFMLAGLNYVLDGRYWRAGIMIGLGASVKLLPALIIPSTATYLLKSRRLGVKEIIIKMVVVPFMVFVLVSLPFLSTPIHYMRHILQHAESVGSFTYWVALSAVVNPSIFWFIPIIVFGISVVVSYLKFRDGAREYIRVSALTMLSFLATSPKVNIQHTIVIIPLVLLYDKFLSSRDVALKFGLFMLVGAIWLSSSMTILYNYSLEYLGKVYTPDTYEFGPGAVSLIVSSILGGVMLFRLMLDLAGLSTFESRLISGRWGISAILLSSLIVFSIYSSPSGVKIPYADIRIGIPESVDSAFTPGRGVSVDAYLKHYNVNYVVLTWSPDFVNTYRGFDPSRDVTEYARFRTGSNRWRMEDVSWLIDELKSRNVKVLLGVYLTVEDIKPHYGVQGYSTSWIKGHPNLIGPGGALLFNEKIEVEGRDPYPYSKYFADQIRRILGDMGFDGVYLMGWGNTMTRNSSHILPLLRELRGLGKPVFVEGPEATCCAGDVVKLLEVSDYVVLKTGPWVYTVYYARTDNVTLTDFKRYISEILSNITDEDRDRVLFSLYVFDFVEGWTTPATQIHIEAREFYGSGLRKGYALYYTSRYVPYKVVIEDLGQNIS